MAVGAPFVAAQSPSPVAAYKLGHSFHGESFDSGPRQKPWEMAGIGEAHFPITTKNPEVQKWFDQGNALLHSFWFYEAERAFRWCLKLEPDNAMAYWGLARAVEEGPRSSDPEVDRAAEFIREAAKRKDQRKRARAPFHRSFAKRRSCAIPCSTKTARSITKSTAAATRKCSKPSASGIRTIWRRARCWRWPTWASSRYGTELIIREILVTAAQPSRRAPLSHPQLGLSRARAGTGELPPLHRTGARHRPRAAHAGSHLQHRRHVA